MYFKKLRLQKKLANKAMVNDRFYTYTKESCPCWSGYLKILDQLNLAILVAQGFK